MPTAREPNRWWRDREGEVFWFETTDRADLGVDLNAPQLGEEGNPHWSYDMVTEVRDGDVVVHYRTRPDFEIAGWSRIVGEPYSDPVFWGAHGQASGRGPVAPYRRLGWRVGLDGPFLLDQPVPLDRLRELEPQLRAVRDELQAQAGGAIYFPFQFSDSRPLRATQFYLTKAPRAMIEAVPELAAVAELARRTAPTASQPAPEAGATGLGTEYREEDEDVTTSERDPFSVDPAIVDRGLRAHKATQNALAAHVRVLGGHPRSPKPGEPSFDLAWEDGDSIVVAEVKSLSDRNEEKQLRLGLGQVLRYAHQLEVKGRHVRAVLAVEREPRDASWEGLCARLNVTLAWPASFGARVT